MKLYYFPVHLIYCENIPLKTYQPSSDWVEFSEDVVREHPTLTFYIDTRTEDEIKLSCDNLRVRCEEFRIKGDL